MIKVTLTIKRADGSVYWVAYFNDQASCDVWLASEQTRPYWDATWSTQIDVTQEPSTVGG